MLNLAGYQETDQIYAGTRTLVYRAIQTTTEQSVIIKVLRNPYPSFHDLVRFRNQYIITGNLEHPAIVQPLSLERYQNGYALVMPDEGALSLLEYWQESPGNLSEFLRIALQLAEALYYLGQNRIIHKDIKPTNILIHPETYQIQLIDFSISSLLPKEQQQLINPNVLEGTLAYISPEQTGRMNRGIDYRTDFYSLGVTLYELLTGVLPFQSNDPVELLHCHIAKEPLAPSELLDTQGNPYPEAISDIILKLMAKNAEERYQSALGLKHDLEQCLQQWEATGEITPFELAQHDRSDRFLIPEKLYGREKEVQILLDAFERIAAGETEMMLVAGFSGIGKTAVVNEVHKPIVEKRGYFIKGKFDQFNRNIPFSAFVQAFRDLMGQLLSESDEELIIWKTNILAAVGKNGQVIIEVIPELELIIGKQPPVPELSGSAAQNRFNLLFQKFIAVFTTPEHPLVMFLDDLQWADSASLNLLKVLMGDGNTGYLLLLGAYRDNEVFPAHPLMLSLAELEKSQAVISTIILKSLALHHINQLVAETLNCSPKIAQALTELVYQKTQGNPFFTTQFLKGLYEDNLIVFNWESDYWECDLVQVRDAAITNDVVEFMASRLNKLSDVTQAILKLAACIGNEFDLGTLAIISQASEEAVAENIWSALQEDLVFPVSDIYKFFQGMETLVEQPKTVTVNYRFLHDRVQQAAYSLIPNEQKQGTHLHIGRLLFQNLSPEERNTQIFTLVNHWNQAIELIENSEEQNQLIHLNFTAGQKAKSSAAYDAALKYFQTALSLMDSESWQTNYPLTLQLHEANAETAYLSGEFEFMEVMIDKVLHHSKSLLDHVKVHEVKIQAQMAQRNQIQALETGVKFLEVLGIQVPDFPQYEDLQTEIALINQLMVGKAIADLANLPLMTDAKQLGKVSILANLISPSYQAKPSLFPWVACKLVQLSIQYGNTSQSAFTYASYGMICIFALQDFDGAEEYGKLACQLDLTPETGDGVGGTYVAGNCLTYYWAHVKETLPLLLKAYQNGLTTGNFQFGVYGFAARSQYLYWMGHNLSTLKLETATVKQAIISLKQENCLLWNQIFEQAILNLLGESVTPWQLIGTAYDETQSIPSQIAEGDRRGLHFVYLHKMTLCYLFDCVPQAIQFAALAESYLDGVFCNLEEIVFSFYDSLIQYSHYFDSDKSRQNSILEKVQANQVKIQRWATHAPMNAQHKYDLIAAEHHRVLGERLKAIELYDLAIAGAKANEYLQEEALANELAAKFYLDWGKEKIAATYMTDAYYCYARWEAKAKTDQLEAKYPQLLSPILHKQQIEFNALDTLESLTQTNTKTSSTQISDTLDLASILQAAQTLSSTIELEQLLDDIVRIVLTNAGAQKAVLLLPQAQQWQLQAMAQLSDDGIVESSRRSQLLSAESSVPIRVIQYVKNTQEPVLIDEGKTDISGIIEGYLLKYQPQSVLCLPLLNQGQLVAIVYLEHPTTKGVFTPNRLTIIQFLCAQAAVSLQNAQLYNQAQQAQLQLIQSEKMSALGSLVAGVAHEINNPTGFLQGNIQPAQDYLQDLLGLIELLLAKCPSNDPQITEEIEEIDLEFIREDFPKLLASMYLGVKQIRNLSHSLRIFSRQEQDQKVSFNIHQGIDSTLVILKHRMKANNQRPKIEVVKDYQEIPEVQCFPSQLNQVFMNILANAIEAFDEANQGRTYGEIQTKPNRIIIRTRILNDTHLKIEIKDNGCGIKLEMKNRIFEQGFTTKKVGKGTGLGMAISHQIITDKHGGTITCDSTIRQGTTFTIVLPISG